MKPEDIEFEEFLMQALRESAEFSSLDEKTMRGIVREIIESEAFEIISPEEMAQRETDALFERLGVKK